MYHFEAPRNQTSKDNRSSDFNVDLNQFLGRIREMKPSVSHTAPGDDATGGINLIQPGVGAGIMVNGEGGVDENFIPLYGVKMIEGRNFLPDHPADSTSILLSFFRRSWEYPWLTT